MSPSKPSSPPEAEPSKEPSATQRSARAREGLVALGRRIRALRERNGLTQEDFAQKAGISVSFASLLERGERSPSYDTLLELADALEVPLSELFRDTLGSERDEPWFSRLTDFARATRLTRGQVERLVRVGQAMFEGQDGRGPAKDRGPSCSAEGCEKAVLAKGLCASHYHRARRAAATDPD